MSEKSFEGNSAGSGVVMFLILSNNECNELYLLVKLQSFGIYPFKVHNMNGWSSKKAVMDNIPYFIINFLTLT